MVTYNCILHKHLYLSLYFLITFLLGLCCFMKMKELPFKVCPRACQRSMRGPHLGKLPPGLSSLKN